MTRPPSALMSTLRPSDLRFVDLTAPSLRYQRCAAARRARDQRSIAEFRAHRLDKLGLIDIDDQDPGRSAGHADVGLGIFLSPNRNRLSGFPRLPSLDQRSLAVMAAARKHHDPKLAQPRGVIAKGVTVRRLGRSLTVSKERRGIPHRNGLCGPSGLRRSHMRRSIGRLQNGSPVGIFWRRAASHR